MFLNGAPTFVGGLAIFGRSDSGDYFTYTLMDDSTIPPMAIPNGEWDFWAIGWDSVNVLEGQTKCGFSSSTLDGTDLNIAMALSLANCNNPDFASAGFINVNQFHPIRISSCYTQTIVDQNTTCDNTFKGEHRSFRFSLDTISSFEALPSPEPITSACFDESSNTSGTSVTTVTLPAGDPTGNGAPLNIILEGFSEIGCQGNVESRVLKYGFDDPANDLYVFSGGSQTHVYIDTDVAAPGLPTASSVVISSNNANPIQSKTGDIVTLTFTVDQQLTGNPTVTIGGNAATLGGSYPNYTATYTMTAGDVEGILPFTLDFIDSGGTAASQIVMTTDSSNVNFDKTPPTIGLTTPANASYINSSSNSATFTVSGTCSEAGETVSISVDGGAAVSPVGMVCDGTNFTGTIDTTSHADGARAFTASISDPAGNLMTTGTNTVTKDTVAGTVAITTPPDSSYINAGSDSASFTVSGTCSENGETVSILVDGVPATSPVGMMCDGTNFSGTIDTTGLTEGLRAFTANISDVAGNTTNSTTNNITKDITPPNTATASIQSNNADTTIASTGDTITLNFTTDENVTTTPIVTINGNPATVTPISGTSFTATYTLPGAGTGAVPFTIDFQDDAGNPSTQWTSTTDATAVTLF
ncbi:MAG: hypothetical protein KC478_12890 [Bacteriovoracaceae bacterium]|nr:hypothetical protein [Bacteriovoracaceae bacterium]